MFLYGTWVTVAVRLLRTDISSNYIRLLKITHQPHLTTVGVPTCSVLRLVHLWPGSDHAPARQSREDWVRLECRCLATRGTGSATDVEPAGPVQYHNTSHPKCSCTRQLLNAKASTLTKGRIRKYVTWGTVQSQYSTLVGCLWELYREPPNSVVIMSWRHYKTCRNDRHTRSTGNRRRVYENLCSQFLRVPHSVIKATTCFDVNSCKITRRDVHIVYN